MTEITAKLPKKNKRSYLKVGRKNSIRKYPNIPTSAKSVAARLRFIFHSPNSITQCSYSLYYILNSILRKKSKKI